MSPRVRLAPSNTPRAPIIRSERWAIVAQRTGNESTGVAHGLRHTVQGSAQCRVQNWTLGCILRQRALAAEQAELQQVERIHVGVTQVERAAEEAVRFERLLLLADREQPAQRALELRTQLGEQRRALAQALEVELGDLEVRFGAHHL